MQFLWPKFLFHHQIELARDMGYAAARYGHVMFPENAHEPALRCAELLLGGIGKGWCFYLFFIYYNVCAAESNCTSISHPLNE